jgi:NitT/TauT family transport system substrate-binding protein
MYARLSPNRQLAALAGMMIAVCTFIMPTRSQQLTQVRVSIVPIADLAPLFAAIQEGYFKAEGLDVTTQNNQAGGAVGIPAVVAGAYEIAFTNVPSALLALQQGIDLRIIAATSTVFNQPPDPAGVLARKVDGLHSGKNMEGKTVAVNARNNINWLLARAWVKATGGDPDKVTYREVPIPQSVDALKNKQVDAAMIPDPFLTLGRRDPELEVVGWPMSTVVPRIQPAGFVVTAETAANRPDLIERFLRAYKKGADWVNANVGKEPFIKLVNSYTRMDPALIEAMRYPTAESEVDLGSIKRWVILMRENGLLSTDIDASSKVFRQ